MADIDENTKSTFVKPALNRMPSAEERLVYQKNPGLLNAANFKPRVADGIRPGTPRVPSTPSASPNPAEPTPTPTRTRISPREETPSPAPKLGNARKFSSTATIYAKNTIQAPDVQEIIKCLGRALYWNLKNNESKETKRFKDIFDEQKHTLGDGKRDFSSPNEDEIQEFLNVIFSSQSLSAECGVMAAAYIERLVRLTGLTLHGTNWRRITVGALLLAAKVWEDLAVWNVDWLEGTFPELNVKDINLLEKEFLSALQFTVALKSSVYAKYYFDLRALSDVDDEHFPVKPLDAEGAAMLEAKSRGLEKESQTSPRDVERRAGSLPTIQLPKREKPLSIEELRNKLSHTHEHPDERSDSDSPH